MDRYDFREPIYRNKEIVGYRSIEYDESAISARLITEKPEFKRFKTGFPDIDDAFGGLPYGLTIFNGTSGAGKSKLAKAIAERHNSIYVCAESLMDAPGGRAIPLNFVSWRPMANKAIKELFGAIREFKPDVVFIDSLTIFLSGTTAAVMEADVREGCFRITDMCEGKIPIVGISEMRGGPNNPYSAGGQAVDYSSHLLVTFDRVRINNWNKKKYNAREGERIYTIDICKDRQGMAKQFHEYQITYDSNNEPRLRMISWAEERGD